MDPGSNKNKQVFDSKASTYDEEFSHSYVGKVQRNNIYAFVTDQLKGKTNLEILEINCGTGEDIPFLQQYGKVTATDVSEEMLKISIQKNSGINVLKLDLNLSIQFDKKFDLIFSNFGGLNCISPKRLKELNTEFKNHLNTGGQLIFTLIHSWSLIEFLYFFIRFKFKKAFRRINKKAKFKEIDIYYYSAREIKIIFADFILEKKYATGILLSGEYMNRIGKRLKIIERKAQWLFPLWGADHRVYVMMKK